MKIIEFTAENVKRLRAVDITPDEHLQVIAGRNAQGKTSVLDAIWLALGGGTASKGTTRPIRDGEDRATVRLDLGDLIVTRTWTGEKSALTVTTADGAKYSGPQGVLDDLVGRLSFDPLAFTNLSAREQAAALLDLVDLPFDPDELERRRGAMFDRRTEVGREGKAAAGHLASLPEVPDGTPDAEVSSAVLFDELVRAQTRIAERDDLYDSAGRAQTRRERAARALDEARAELEQATADEATLLARIRSLPDLPDVEPIKARIATVDETNAAVRAKQDRARAAEQVERITKRYNELTAAIAAVDRERAAGLAGATFPIDGLGFGAEGVTFNGVPFAQASAAEQIRVSLAMAMALNPTLRVIRILDGSLLDAENLALIGEMAREHDYQVWVERVGDGDGIGVVIEDGEVAR